MGAEPETVSDPLKRLETTEELRLAAKKLLDKLGDPRDPKNKKIEVDMLVLLHAIRRSDHGK